MNSYLFGGIISRRTFTLFVSAIGFFVVLLGIGLGISAFATEETVYADVEISNVPDTVLNMLDEGYEFNAEDFAGIALKYTYPVGCDYNPDGTEDIVEEYVLAAEDISLVEIESQSAYYFDEEGYAILTAHINLDGKISELRIHIFDNMNTTLCFVHAGVSTKGSDGEYELDWVEYDDQIYMAKVDGTQFVEERDEEYIYLVGDEDVRIVKYIGEGGDVTVPTTYKGLPISYIMYHTFADTDRFTSITIPEGIKGLEYEAIFCCYGIKTINIPSTAVESDESCIKNVNDVLEAINVAEGNPTLHNNNGDGVLYYANGLGLMIYPCKKPDTSYTIPDTVECIAEDAFFGSQNLTEIVMPSDENSVLWAIGSYAFYGSGITSIDLPSTVTVIHEYAFAQCKALESIDFGGAYFLPDYVCYYNDGGNNIPAPLKNVTIPESVTAINKNAFEGQYNIENLTIPATVNNIDDYAFTGTDVYDSEEKTLVINGYAGTAAENYCTDHGEELNVQFNALSGDDSLHIPFTAIGSIGGEAGTLVSMKNEDTGFGLSEFVYPREGSDELVFCCDLEDGTVVDITIGGNGYTTYTIEGFVVGEDTIPADITIYAGDIDGDNIINIDDIIMMVNQYSLPVDYDIYPENYAYWYYDFNGSGYIDIFDISIAVNNIKNLYGAY